MSEHDPRKSAKEDETYYTYSENKDLRLRQHVDAICVIHLHSTADWKPYVNSRRMREA